MEGDAGRGKVGQLKKIVRARNGSVRMVEDLGKRKRDEMEGIGRDGREKKMFKIFQKSKKTQRSPVRKVGEGANENDEGNNKDEEYVEKTGGKFRGDKKGDERVGRKGKNGGKD